jgi:hypothetical protein
MSPESESDSAAASGTARSPLLGCAGRPRSLSRRAALPWLYPSTCATPKPRPVSSKLEF